MKARLVGMSFAVSPGVACYIPVGHRGTDAVAQLPRAEVLERLRPWLRDRGAAKLLHHSKYDAHVFFNEGIALAGIAADTMLQAYVQIGRAHVCTPVTTAHLVCRLLLEQNKRKH